MQEKKVHRGNKLGRSIKNPKQNKNKEGPTFSCIPMLRSNDSPNYRHTYRYSFNNQGSISSILIYFFRVKYVFGPSRLSEFWD